MTDPTQFDPDAFSPFAAELQHLRRQCTELQSKCTQLLLENRALRRNAAPIHGQVLAFMHASDQPVRDTPGVPPDAVVRLRIGLILEEAFEFVTACYGVSSATAILQEFMHEIQSTPFAVNTVAVADALGDLAYVVEGAFLSFGIEPQPVIDAIHASNLTKTIGPRRVDPETGKILKPEGWAPPDLATVLRAQGWKL